MVAGARPNRSLFLILLLIFPVLACAASITGGVRDDDTLAPLSGATVRLEQGGQIKYITTTNGSGVYTISNVTAGAYNLVALNSAYCNWIQARNISGAMTGQNIAMTPGPMITGGVRNSATSNPIGGATVRLEQSGQIRYTTMANGSGVYTFAKTTPGTYDLVAIASEYVNWSSSRTVNCGTDLTEQNIAMTPLMTIPALLHPTGNVAVTMLLLQWQQVAGASGYELEIDAEQVLVDGGGVTSYAPVLEYGLHAWRARAREISGLYGAWSPYGQFSYVDDTLDLEASVGPGWDIFVPEGMCGASGEAEYRYGPSIIVNDDNSIDAWFSSPGNGGGQWDWIRYNRSIDGGLTWEYSWAPHVDPLMPDVVLTPSAAPSSDRYSCCDPGAIKFGGYYYIGYTSAGNAIGRCNSVYVARATSPGGPFEKWNGNGWGGSLPQPFIVWPCDAETDWGASEPSFVVKGDVLYVYYEWTGVGTRVATAVVSELNWPGHLTYFGEPAIPKVLGEDSRDVKYVEALDLFMAVAVGNRFGSASYVHVWKSSDGILFAPAGEIMDGTMGEAHNIGISGTRDGHLDLSVDNFVAYAYGARPAPPAPACWSTYLNPVTVSSIVAAVWGRGCTQEFRLYANAPNPFNPLTTIQYELPSAGRVRVGVYDLQGRLVRMLVDHERPAGRHEALWNGTGQDDRQVASGMYFYRMEAGAFSDTKRMTLIK